MTELIWDAIRTILEREGCKERGGKWIGNAPSLLSPGSDSQSFAARPDSNLQNGVWNYTAGDRKGTFIHSDPSKCLATILGIDKSKYTTSKYKAQKSTTQSYLDYAKAHYVEWEVFANAEWQVGTHPYHEKRGKTLYMVCNDNAQRHRFLDGNHPKWLPFKTPEWFAANPDKDAKVKPQWYGLDKSITKASILNTPLIICNGQPSVIVAHNYGLPACAVTDGENKVPSDAILSELKRKWNGRIIIAMDCDTAGKGAAQKWKSVLPQATVIDLNGDDLFDLADHCGLFTDTSLQKILDYAKFSTNEVPEQNPPKAPDPIREAAIAANNLTNAIKGDDTRKDEAMKRMKDVFDEYEARTYGVELKRGTVEANQLFEDIEDRFDNPQRIVGLRSRFKTLNYAMGGFGSGNVRILGSTGTGKSTVTACLANDFMTQAQGIVLSTEMTIGEFQLMMITDMMGTTGSPLRIRDDPLTTLSLMTGYRHKWDIDAHGKKIPCRHKLTDVDKLNYKQCKNRLYHHMGKGDILFPTESNPNPKALYIAIEKAKQRNPNLKWIIVDSLTHLAGANKGSDKRQKIDDMSGMLVNIRKDFDMLELSVAQIGRKIKEKGRTTLEPTLHDAKESGGVEEDATKLLGLYYHHYYVSKGYAEPNDYLPEGTGQINLIKGRFSGDGEKIRFDFRGGVGCAEHSKS